jgi:prolyl-tRNA editing enzyme YbaK/EbsC (Cys-tRNA(Pro) deacylase)
MSLRAGCFSRRGNLLLSDEVLKKLKSLYLLEDCFTLRVRNDTLLARNVNNSITMQISTLLEMTTMALSPSAQKVQDYLITNGYAHAVVEHSQSTRSSAEAAEAIGCIVAQIAKSLVFISRISQKPVLVIASGANRVNTKRVGEALGEPIDRANPDFVHQATGFAIGGVPPVALFQPVVTFIDEDLLQFESIWAAAGAPTAVFNLTPAELVKMTGGRVIQINEG